MIELLFNVIDCDIVKNEKFKDEKNICSPFGD